ncbi:MAG: SMP-30/gluconolactonase/LRE family protein [Stappiaceae bacterium]
MPAEMIFPAQNTVGESIVWDAPNSRLLWVDIVGKTIHSLAPETGRHRSWSAPDFVTSIGLRKDGGAIVGLTREICLWDFDGPFNTFVSVEPDLPGNRLNEGVVGPDGAFWVGTMQNNIAADGSPVDILEDSGRLYRCAPDGQIMRVSEDRFGITNTLVWSDNGHLITADTLKNEIYRYNVDAATGALSGRKTIISNFKHGLPDGSTMDAEGYIWNCRVVGGSCMLRFSPEGEIDRVVDLPCSWPTSCTFGGENLDTLYVTSARFTMEPEHLEQNPQEGGLFALKVGVKGRQSHRFG